MSSLKAKSLKNLSKDSSKDFLVSLNNENETILPTLPVQEPPTTTYTYEYEYSTERAETCVRTYARTHVSFGEGEGESRREELEEEEEEVWNVIRRKWKWRIS